MCEFLTLTVPFSFTRWLQDQNIMRVAEIETLLYDIDNKSQEAWDSSSPGLNQTDDMIDRALLSSQQEAHIPHHDDRTWLVDVDREGATKMLEKKRAETFLIRPRGDGSFALSVV